MRRERGAEFERVRSELERRGLLLQHDRALPSLTGRVAGEAIRGSWWSHPRAHDIYDVAQWLQHQRDVLLVKLIAAKVTYVHRKLWPSLVAVAQSGDAWQVGGLSPSARSLHERIERAGALRTDRLRGSRPIGAAVRELEARLLVHSDEVHTESGAHAKLVETWPHWLARSGRSIRAQPVAEARERLERAVRALSQDAEPRKLLPW